VIARLARREARALTLVPDLELRTDGAPPQLRLTLLSCPSCDAGPVPPPLREVAAGAAGTLPTLTALRCEVLTARSLLALTLLGRRLGPIRVRTRAAYWAEHPDTDLDALDRHESWLDGLFPALESGGPLPPLPDDPHRVLPAATRTAGAPYGPAHFLTPHADGPRLAELNRTYLAVRLVAVREALS
jgi:hypothetical protein